MQSIWQNLMSVAPEYLAIAMPYFEIVKKIFINWWWVILPFILWKPATFFWLWWRNELWWGKQKQIILEIRIPRENPKPIRAMEPVITGLWQIWSEPNWIEKWWDGQDLLSYSFDIVSIDGVPHFYIRCHKSARGLVETHLYSQFPEAEIFEVDDYAKKVPQDIPNKEWDLWGTDYKLTNKNCYPIKTYRDFETEREAKEEKRVDPMASLLEGMGSLKKGEQIWVQIRATAIGGEIPWIKQGKDEINALVSRKKPSPATTILEDVITVLKGGTLSAGEEKKTEVIPPEMKLTPGERDIVAGIERKISKLGFEVGIRYIYLSKKDVMVKPNLRLPMSYFTNFGTNTCAPVPNGKTIPKVRKKWYDPFWFPERRLYLKKRKIFRRYVERLPYDYPLSGGSFVLNTEELATIWHFPSRTLTPASQVPRVEAKKGEAPLELPIEE